MGIEFLRDHYGNPLFIAVEANRTLFHAVTLWQRKLFVRLALKDAKLLQLRVDKLEALAKSIHYEADSHEGLFATNPKVIWLDDQRSFSTAGDPCVAAERYINTCRKALENDTRGINERKVMQAIDKFITARAAQTAEDDDFARDIAWAKMILCERSPNSGYGIVVVGENHVQNRQSYLGSLLAAAECECYIRYLANAATANDRWATPTA